MGKYAVSYKSLNSRIKISRRLSIEAPRQAILKKALATVGILALVLGIAGFFPATAEATDPESGTITVCKIIIDLEGNVIDGNAQSDVDFTITGFTPDPETSEGAPVGELPATVFTTPITFNADLLSDVEGDDAQCETYENLPLGGYFYDDEAISGGTWEAPLYNDQYQTTLTTLLDFFGYDGNLFDGNAGDDGARNLDSDGHIVLTAERPDRTLVILNQSALEESGDLELVKDIDNAAPHQGDSVVYTITVTNFGPSDASGVSVSDILPGGLSFLSSSTTVGTYDDGSGIWTIGVLANGASAVLEITAEVTANEGEGVVNTATVSGEPNVNADNDTDDASLTVASEEADNGDNGGPGGGGGSPGGSSPSSTNSDGGGSSGGGGGGGGIADPNLNTPNTGGSSGGSVAGAQTPPASGGSTARSGGSSSPADGSTPVAPQVQGEILPRTGMDVMTLGLLFSLLGYGVLAPKKPRTKVAISD